MSEEWRDVVGYEGRYYVSDQGRVRSAKLHIVDSLNRPRTIHARVLRPAITKDGYPNVALTIHGKSRTWNVHRLVALAFLGPPPPGHMVCHADSVPSNNVLSNLRWGTNRDNIADSYKTGLRNRLTDKPGAKLTWDDVGVIRSKLRVGTPQKVIALEFGVTSTTISNIKTERMWRNVA